LRDSLSGGDRFRTDNWPKVVQFGIATGSFDCLQTLAFCAGKESYMQTLKIKLFPLAIALIGAIAASGGYTRWH
jgi:hypothetical protein